jgi:GT2 family glycosyltransferase
MTPPLVTIAVPSFNQGRYLADTLASIFQQELPVEVFVLDGGSTDESVDVIKKWEPRLAGWRSHRDGGQAAAINEGIRAGTAPFVCWLNSDDWFLPGGINHLLDGLQAHPQAPASYGRAWNVVQNTGARSPIWVEPFDQRRLALRCIVSQPATLMRRTAWEAVGGVDGRLHMAMDYDLWWRLFKQFGPMQFVDKFVAVNRDHEATKTRTLRSLHYREAMAVVRKYNHHVPLKWWWSQPYSVWFKSLTG